MRLFVAIPVPGEISRQVAGAMDAFDSVRDRIKEVDPRQYHLTLNFLGDTAPHKAKKIADILHETLRDAGAFAVSFAGAGAFPGPRRPKVLWVGVEKGAPEMTRLAGAIDNAMAELGYPRENRPFSPHLTLGRFRNQRGGRDVTGELQALKGFTTDCFTCGSIHLVRSRLTPGGPIYTMQESFAL